MSTPEHYPPAERSDLVEQLHGHRVADPYRWLEDTTDPRTQQWSADQQDLFAAVSAGWTARESFTGRLGELTACGSVGVPIWRGAHRFFTLRTAAQEHGVVMVADAQAPTDPHQPQLGARILIDPMQLDPTGLTTLDAWQPDREGRYVAYQVSEGGSEESVLRVLRVEDGALVDGPIDRARYSPVAWLPGGLDGAPAFYYVRRLPPEQLPADEQQYHRRVWLHVLGTDPDQDVEIFGSDHDPRTYFGVGLSRDGRWLTVSAAVGTAPRNDLWIADLQSSAQAARAPQFVPVLTGRDAQTSAGVGRDGRLYVFTDLDAPRGRLAVTDPTRPGPEHWVELLAEDPHAVLEDFAVLDGPDLPGAGLLLVSRSRHTVSSLSVHHADTGAAVLDADGAPLLVPLPGAGSLGGLVTRPEGGPVAWLTYTDHTRPPHVYRWDATEQRLALFAAPPGPTADASTDRAIRTQQVAYPSSDGTTIRMFLIARADLLGAEGTPTAPLPTILYGYGGFGLPLSPGYSAGILAWVEAGGAYAVAGLRGGGEEGEQWHRDGMLAAKQNVFDDFHSAAEYLHRTGWSTPASLGISGGSNGGLLVGAATAQRPELFRAVVCSAPLLDMVRYERFGLGATWNVEYGSAEVPEELGWLLGYSPYHRVLQDSDQGRPYPAVLFTVFDGDSRVDPLHARKMCAALQHALARRAPRERPVLLRAERDVGHGARSLSRSIALSADTLAFLAAELGLSVSQQEGSTVPAAAP